MADPVARAREIAARLAAAAIPGGDALGKRKSRWEVRQLSYAMTGSVIYTDGGFYFTVILSVFWSVIRVMVCFRFWLLFYLGGYICGVYCVLGVPMSLLLLHD